MNIIEQYVSSRELWHLEFRMIDYQLAAQHSQLWFIDTNKLLSMSTATSR